MKKEILIIVLLLLLSYPAVKSLLIPGGFTSHDLTHHVIRQISMDKLLSEGQFPPRWSGELNNGYGYPVFLFNYPLPAMIGEVFHKLGFNFLYSVKAILFSSMILSILGMYLFLKEFFGLRLAAFLGAIFYLYAPIRFLNIYVSAAVGSALAAAIVPFVFWSLVLISKNRKWGITLGAFCFASLILAHNVTAVMFTPVLLVFAWMIGGIRMQKKVLLMFLLGLGLSCWFWLPAFWEKQYIKFDQIYEGYYRDQFVSISQLTHSPWGYGLSHPQDPEPGDMSYQLGLIHIAVIMVFSIWFVIYGRKSKDKILGLLVLIGFISSIFLMLKSSLFIWQALPFLHLMQFPLRFQAILIFLVSIATALLIKNLPFRRVIFVILLILVIYANRNHWKINEVFDPGENYYLSQKTTTASYSEHMPKWGKAMSKPALSKLEFVRGGGSINIVENKSAKVLAQVESTESSKLRLNQFYFPGWQIQVDETPVAFNYKIDGESYGMPVFDIDKGRHVITAEFKNTLVRNISDTIALVSVIVWLWWLCVKKS